MGFFDFIEKAIDGLNNFAASEPMQKAISDSVDRAFKDAEKAERDYDAGRISFEQYMSKVDNAIKLAGNYTKYQDSLNRMKNKR